jgi:hypothetical protein
MATFLADPFSAPEDMNITKSRISVGAIQVNICIR